MKKKFLVFVLSLVTLVLAACQADAQKNDSQHDTIKLGSFGSDYEIWSYIDSSGLAQEAGIDLEVIDMNGQGSMNEAVANDDLDANAYQSLAYLEAYNEEAPTELAAVAFTYIEPMGIYAQEIKDIQDIPESGEITLPADPSEQARALNLLESAGLIRLAKKENGLQQIDDVVENPKNLTLTEIHDASLPRSLEDVDASVIGNTIAMDSGLNLREDAIYIEEVSEANIGNYNVIASRKEKADDPRIQKLAELYHHPQVQDYIETQFNGTKVEITKDIEEIKETK